MSYERWIGSWEDKLAAVQKERYSVIPSPQSRQTPSIMYNKLLFRIVKRFDKEMRSAFRFYLRGEIPELVLEEEDPLSWFKKLEDRNIISIGNLPMLESFLESKSMERLLYDIKELRKKVEIIKYLSYDLQSQNHKNVGESLVCDGKAFRFNNRISSKER